MANTYKGAGLPKPGAHENRHHVFFIKEWYNGELERRRFRAHPAAVHLMDIDEHRELHAIVKPPPKPNARLMRDAVGFMEALPAELPRLAQLGMVAVFFYEQQGSRNDDFAVCGRIAMSLTTQHLIIDQGSQAYYEATAGGVQLEPLTRPIPQAIAL